MKIQAEVKERPPNKKQSFLFFHLLFFHFTIKKQPFILSKIRISSLAFRCYFAIILYLIS
jgi:hypothetical protein